MTLKRWTREETEYLKQNFNNKTYKEIGDILGRSEDAIQIRLCRLKLTTPKKEANDNFFNIWSSDMAYILGYIITDGNVYNNTLRIDLSRKDIDVLEYMVKHIAPSYSIEKYSRITIGTKMRDYCTLRINSKKIIESLFKLGVIERKTGREILPSCPDQFKPDLLRGIFDGDGSVWYKKNNNLGMEIISASESFLYSVKNDLGFNLGRLIKRVSKSTGREYFIWRTDTQGHIRQIANFMYYNGHPFCLQRKKERFYS